MRIAALLALLALLAACDADPVIGPFDSSTYDVYLVTLVTSDGVPEVTATLGLGFNPNEVILPGEEACDGEGGLYGVWASDASGDEVEGVVVGGVGCGGDAVLIDLLGGRSTDAPVEYRIEGSRADGRLEGTWTRGTAGEAGTVSGRLVRTAFEPIYLD